MVNHFNDYVLIVIVLCPNIFLLVLYYGLFWTFLLKCLVIANYWPVVLNLFLLVYYSINVKSVVIYKLLSLLTHFILFNFTKSRILKSVSGTYCIILTTMLLRKIIHCLKTFLPYKLYKSEQKLYCT